VCEASESGRFELGDLVSHSKRYEIVALIGEGGMGRVYRAYDPVLERDVALKILKPDVPARERARFRREALYGAKFCHPGVVRVFELVDDAHDEETWFSMEYLPGKDMEAVIGRARARGKMIPFRLVADVFRQTLGALQYAHDCGVVHRDVKPANLFVTRDPNTNFVTTKLLDFGVALKLAEGEQDAKQLVGDPRYMAPEQTKKALVTDHRADIYAAGMSLYHLVTTRHPFEHLMDGSHRELMAAQRGEKPLPLSNFLPIETPVDVACGLDVVFEKATAKDPDDRFSSARDMQQALFGVLNGL
jgi:serine/threonine-protein kinase